MVRIDGVLMPAARAAYLAHHGAIPPGHVVHHRCGNGECIAPRHLQAVTPSQHAKLHALLRRGETA
ncbi:MAG: HNH endonuclease signature motif containing protein [Candidatus Methylomirabilales bacterium]